MNMLEDIAIDDAHCDLIYGLLRSQKPRSILEIGFGAGKSSDAIFKAIYYNAYCFYEPYYTIVDNWHDWNGEKPEHAAKMGQGFCKFINMDEGEFVNSCTETFDFILIDADHSKSDQYFDRVYDSLLNPAGILIYHDVDNPGWPNLKQITAAIRSRGELNFYRFNNNSSPGERCDRGLLVIFK